MMSRRLITGFCAAVILLLVLYLGVTWVTEGGFSDSGTGDASSTRRGDKSEVVETDEDDVKKPTGEVSVDLPPVTEISITSQTQVNSSADAESVLEQALPALELGNGASLKVTGETADAQGYRYFQVQQTYKGIEVYGAASVLEVQDGAAETLYGTTVQGLEVDISPRYEALEALKIALTNFGVPDNRIVDALRKEPKLIILLTDEGGLLCWVLQAHLENPETVPEIFTIDAHHPRIILRSQIILE